MDRSEEFKKIVNIFVHEELPVSKDSIHQNHGRSLSLELSEFLRTGLRVSSAVKENDVSLKKMEKLSERKEFSNDPTSEMTDISSSFHSKVLLMKRDLELLKSICSNDDRSRSRVGSQQAVHYNIMTETLSKSLSKQVQLFKIYLNKHTENVKKRQQRVQKYGSNNGSDTSSNSFGIERQQYAMFSSTSLVSTNNVKSLSNGSSSYQHNGIKDESVSGGMYRRRPTATATAPTAIITNPEHFNSSDTTDNRGMRTSAHDKMKLDQMQHEKNRYFKEQRLSGAQKIEASIAQVFLRPVISFRQINYLCVNFADGRVVLANGDVGDGAVRDNLAY